MLPKDKLLVVAGALSGEKIPQLWRMNPDGSARLRLTHEKLPCRQPRWSGDATSILYALDTGKTNTTTGESVLTWMRCAPDGSKRTPASAPETGSPILKLEIESNSDLVTGFRAPGGPLRKLLLSPAAEKFWDETGISGGALNLIALPGTTAFVLATQLAGGNREGKWHTALKVEIATGRAEPWGEYGYSGFCVSPNNRQFVTCFNRLVDRKEEHAVCIGSMDAPRNLKRILTSPELIFADWCGGKRV
ncbi:TolB family protein [Armatimonas sp.]|uniref:TolB family protein n=1 Tax=Armatimonas sp. TaxID=1872638 RepID=UPI0037500D77